MSPWFLALGGNRPLVLPFGYTLSCQLQVEGVIPASNSEASREIVR